MFGSAGVRARARAFDSREEGARGSEDRVAQIADATTTIRRGDEFASLAASLVAAGPAGGGGARAGVWPGGGHRQRGGDLATGICNGLDTMGGREGRLEGWLRDRLAVPGAPALGGGWRIFQLPLSTSFSSSFPSSSYFFDHFSPSRRKKTVEETASPFATITESMDSLRGLTWTTGWLRGWSVTLGGRNRGSLA